MKNTAKGLMSFVMACAVLFSCACSKEKKTDTSVTSASDTEVSAPEESKDPSEISSEPKSESDEGPEDTSNGGHQPTLEYMTGDELEKSFLDACEELNIKVQKREYDGKYDYVGTDLNYNVVFVVCPDQTTAKGSHQAVLDFGGWYEEDKVIREVKKKKDDFELIAYYCADKDEEEDLLFVEAYIQNITFGFEAWNSESVLMVEVLLHALGIIL